jgi:hypothetical protein
MVINEEEPSVDCAGRAGRLGAVFENEKIDFKNDRCYKRYRCGGEKRRD